MLTSRERKSLHDDIAGTVVVHDPNQVLANPQVQVRLNRLAGPGSSWNVQPATGELAQSIVTSWLGLAGLTATFICAPRRRLATFASGTRFMNTASIGLEPSIGNSALITYSGSLGSGSEGSTSPTVLPEAENSRMTA